MSKKDEVAKPKKSKSKIKHLRMEDIIRNNSIEVDHTIRKIKEREFRHTLISVCIFLLIIIFSSFTVIFSVQKIGEYNVIVEGDLVITFDKNGEVLDDVVTLDGDDLLGEEEALKKDGYKFTLSNNTSKKVMYIVKLIDDDDMVRFDDCKNMLFDKKNIFLALNGKTIGNLSELSDDDEIVVVKDVLNGNTSKDFKLNVWVDNSVVNAKHYHGKIVIEEVK